MNRTVLIKKIKEFIPVKENKIEETTVSIGDMTFLNLRDSLIGLGTILDEDFDVNSYVLTVPSGIANKNSAIVAIQHENNQLLILSYAKEGLISQHTASKALGKVLQRLSCYLI